MDGDRRRRLAETQGILILRQLRAAGVALPAILFADLDDAGRADYLQRTLGPLAIGSSHLGIRERLHVALVAMDLQAWTGDQDRKCLGSFSTGVLFDEK